MEEKSRTFLTITVFDFCLQQIPHTLCELLTLKKTLFCSINIKIEIIFSLLTPLTYAY